MSATYANSLRLTGGAKKKKSRACSAKKKKSCQQSKKCKWSKGKKGKSRKKKSCHSKKRRSKKKTKRKVDLKTLHAMPPAVQPWSPQQSMAQSLAPTAPTVIFAPTSRGAAAGKSKTPDSGVSEWACPICTLVQIL